MCGLSAIVDFAPRQDLVPCLLRMHDEVPHRGPDGEGFAIADERGALKSAAARNHLPAAADPQALRVGMAFRWLKIQDPREVAAQPVVSHDHSVCLIFNGEIYNFKALREELGRHGHVFRSDGDAEVLLACYLQWGTSMLQRLTGMWAFILLDLRERVVLIARDRFGIKPLYYCRMGSRLLIGSEIKQLIAAGAPARANIASVAGFIQGYRPASPDETFFDDICAQPAATLARIELDAPPDNPTFTAYWQLPESGRASSKPLDRTADDLAALLSSSVADHLSGPAPTGHLISGGLDSSIVAALAAKAHARRDPGGSGFSMVLRPTLAQDESPFIDRVSSHLGFHTAKTELTAAWLKASIDRISRTQEEPVPGPASAGQFLVFELAARHGVRVILDGQGADEIFAGYLRHQIAFLRDCARLRLPGSLMIEAISLLLRSPRLVSRAATAAIRRRLHRSAPPTQALLREGRRAAGAPKAGLNEMLRNDVTCGNMRAVLGLTDRNSMAHSIEARVPYIDHRVVEFAFGLPDEHKVGFGQRKRILRRVAGRLLPQSIAQRTDRIGFGTPTLQWLRRDFQEELSDLAHRPVFRNSSIVAPAQIESFIAGFLAGQHSDAGTAWRLFAVERWAAAYSVGGL